MTITDQPTCLACMATGEGVRFPMTPKSGARFGTICAECDSKSAWAQSPLECVDCEDLLTNETACGNRAYGDPRCEDCHMKWR